MFDRALFELAGAKRVFASVALCAFLRAAFVLGQAYFLSYAIVSLCAGEALGSPLSLGSSFSLGAPFSFSSPFSLGSSFSLGAPFSFSSPLSLGSPFPLGSPLFALAAFGVCFVLQGVCARQADAISGRFALAQSACVQEELLESLLSAGINPREREGSGAYAALASDGIDSFGEYVRLSIQKMVMLATVPPCLLVVVLVVDWVSALIMALTFPAIVFMMVLVGSTAHKAAERRHVEFSYLSGHFIDSLRGLSTLRAFGQSRDYVQTIYATSERFREATMKTLRIATLSSAVLDFAATMSLAAVAIMLGFRMTAGDVGFLPALFVLVVVPEYFKPLREFAADYHATLEGKTAFESIRAQLDARGAAMGDAASCCVGDVVSCSASDVDSRCGSSAPKPGGAISERSNSTQKPGGAPTLELSNVSFSHSNAQAHPDAPDAPNAPNAQAHAPSPAALKNISFVAQSPQMIGIVGTSGSGKSTLASLIAGFLCPSSGDIFLNGSRMQLNTQEWRSHVLYIPQNPYIFAASLAENIAFYTPDATREAIEAAAAAVGLDALITQLPHGLDEQIGDGGRALSGGECQRVALARALLDTERSVVIFDEPTAHLDIETELELKECLLPIMKNRLVFFATHRLHWLNAFDAVAVLDEGHLVKFGPPSDLLLDADSPAANPLARLRDAWDDARGDAWDDARGDAWGDA